MYSSAFFILPILIELFDLVCVVCPPPTLFKIDSAAACLKEKNVEASREGDYQENSSNIYSCIQWAASIQSSFTQN